MACASYTQRLLKLTNLADALFTENMTGRNTLRVMHIPELNAAILIVACRFLDIAKLFAYHSGAVWSRSARFNAMHIISEVLINYDRQVARWKEEKLKVRHGYAFPTTNITEVARREKLREIIESERQLVEDIKAYTGISKFIAEKIRKQRSASIMLDTVSLASSIIALTDQAYADSMRRYICMAVTNSEVDVTINLASSQQKSKIIMETLKESMNFTDSVIMAMSNEHFYVISYVDKPEVVCGFAITNQEVHRPAGECKDVVITYIETMQGHRRALIASRLLECIKASARDNGYHCMYAVSVYPNLLFWRKCGFEARQNGNKSQLAFCCLNKMSFYNILN